MENTPKSTNVDPSLIKNLNECGPELLLQRGNCKTAFQGQPNQGILEENCFFCQIESFCNEYLNQDPSITSVVDFIKVYQR